MDQLIIIIALLIISGISSWLKKRAQEQEEASRKGAPPMGGPQVPPPVRPPQEKAPVDWEEEMRRILDMPPVEKAPPAPVAPPPPPVIIVSSEPSPVPRAAAPARVAGLPAEEPATGVLHHAADTMHAARHLQETVQERIQKAGELRGAATHSTPAIVFVKRREKLPADFQERSGLRKAFMASVVFGPPKALEETAGTPF